MDQDTWKTATGRRLEICRMDDDHLANCIVMLERRLNLIKTFLPFPVSAGDEEELAYLQIQYYSIMDAEPGDLWPIYDRLTKEVDRRAAVRDLNGVNFWQKHSLGLHGL